MAAKKNVRKSRPASGARAQINGSRSGVLCPVVAVGASAGGLSAFQALLKALPATSGMAFVLIQHLEPKHESALSTLLANVTRMPVMEVTDGIQAEPGHVYVIPPNKTMTIRGGALRLAPRTEPAGAQRPIDEFAMALAEERGSNAIGVVLSGTGSDGTYGLRAIRAAGGITFAQDPKTAQWPAMPMNAIAGGSADFVLPPRRIAAELVRIGRQPHLTEARRVPEGSDLEKICLVLQSVTGVDFRLYKQPTVRRRISRRMGLHKIASLPKYAQFLKQNPDEAHALSDDIFIHVTSFFRDPEAFQALHKKVLSKLSPKKPAGKRAEDEPLRVWVAGCSTGEEVYSIAMLLLEELGETASRARIQIFGTDIQERALEYARTGIYSESAVTGVPPARLKRFFVRRDHGYQILKSIRDLCVFARHDLTRDPPFSKLDLISCRNVLIYMGPSLQRRILSTFQYALKPGGHLFLGTSESVSDYSEAFTPADARQRIFVRKAPASAFREMPKAANGFREHDSVSVRTQPPAAMDLRKEAETALLEHYAPAALVVDQDLHIVHFQGNTSPYLAPATGQPSFHLLKMARPEFVVDLRTAIAKARKENVTVRRDGLEFVDEGRPTVVRLEVRPLPKRSGRKQELLVVFEKSALASPGEAPRTGRKHSAEKSAVTERQLAATREHLRTLIAEHETAQEEMQAANEEILSSNEELQSTNEELETAKEELQSSNEELVTLNDELQFRNAELNVLMHDLSNLLVGVDIPVLVLDAELRVRRFTPVAGELLNLIAGDVGRPFSNIASNLDVPDWRELLTDVTMNGRAVEREVADRTGHRYSMRVRPYKTDDNKIEGVLIVMLDTDRVYKARDHAQKSGDYARTIVQTIREALAVVNSEFRVVSVNQRYCELFQVSAEEIEGKPFLGRNPGQCDAPRLGRLLGEIFSTGKELKDFEIERSFSRIGPRSLVIGAGRIGNSSSILVAIEDATVRKQAMEGLEQSESAIRALLNASDQSVITIDARGKIVTINAQPEKMFGYSDGELSGQPAGILLPDHVWREFRTDHRGKPQKQVMGLVVECRRKDGTVFPAEVSISSVETPSGRHTVAFVSDVTQRRQLESSAQTQTTQIRALAARLLTVQEEERRRVSRELHDHICQQLASLAIDLSAFSAAPPPPVKQREQRLAELQARVVMISEATRHIAYQLHPSVLDDLGLVASLRSLCKQFSDGEGMRVEFQHGQLPTAVPREVASCLYRVAQESLQNIASHSGAKKATVRLGMKKGVITLSISDDGTGFAMDDVRGRGGLGLVGMEERARLVSGQLSVEAHPGDGSRITLRVPLKESEL